MQKITIEHKKQLTDDIYEVKEVTYEIPRSISYKGNFMSYDSHWRTYYGVNNSELKAEDYIKEQLEEKKLKNKQNQNEEDLSK